MERSTAGANRSLQVAQEIVAEGGAIIIYPEGTLTRDPDLWPMKGHTGAARLALEGGIPVVPIAHWGAHEVFPRYAKRFHIFPRKRSRVVVGDPVDLSAFAGRPLDKATLTGGHRRHHGRRHRPAGRPAGSSPRRCAGIRPSSSSQSTAASWSAAAADRRTGAR